MRETSDNAGSDRIARAEENDRDCFSRLLKSEKGWCTRGKDRVDFQSDQFRGELRKTIFLSLCLAVLNENVLPINVAEFPQPLNKYIEVGVGMRRAEIQNPNSWSCR